MGLDIGPTTSALRRALRRLRITGDGSGGGDGAMSRAITTRAAVQAGVDWVWPWWLEHQLDPASPAFNDLKRELGHLVMEEQQRHHNDERRMAAID